MNPNQIVDLSTDDSNDEVIRKKINRKKLNELRVYVPFLEFLSKLDPVKNKHNAQLVRWLTLNKEFPARMATTCENYIISKYNCLKRTTEIPPHIAAIFTEKDAILISDEDDEQQTTVLATNNSARLFIDLEDDEPTDSLEKTGVGVPSSTAKKKYSSAANSTINNHATDCLEDSNEIILEEGEILSNSEEINDGTDKKNSLSNSIQKITAKKSESIFSTPSEDEILNQELFKRIDCFEDDYSAKNTQTSSKKEKGEKAKMSTLRQKNLENELFSRRSPKPLSDSLSAISSEDAFVVSSRKKKKKKHKCTKKNKEIDQPDSHVSEVENNSDRGKKEACDEVKIMSSKKSRKTSKKQSKEHRNSRFLYISDDDEVDISVKNKNNTETHLAENSKELKRKNDLSDTASSIQHPTVVLSDSNDEEVSQESIQQEKSVKSPSEPASKIVKSVSSPKSGVESISNIETKSQQNKEIQSITTAMQDINNMSLRELNTIYTKLCDATGIQLEELLTDLVNKSKRENEQNLNVDISDTPAQRKSVRDISEQYLNQNNSGNKTQCHKEISNRFAFQQHQIRYQQNQEKAYQPPFDHQQQQIQMQCQTNANCQLQVQLPYQHTLRPGLKLNDPRIVQKLKQIKDSPIHNLIVRDAASFLMNRHAAQMLQRSLPVPEVTSKTATTYGEHKRLRELEKKKELNRQISKTSTIASNQTTEDVRLGDKEGVVTKTTRYDICDTEKDERSSQNLLESSGEESQKKVSQTENGKTTESTEKTIMSFPMNRPLSQTSSLLSEDSLFSSEKRTKSKANSSSGRITPFEREKVVDIVLSAIGPVSDDACKKLKILSNPSHYQKDDRPENALQESPNNSIDSLQNKDRAEIDNRVKKKGRQAQKRSPSKIFGIRELNNLNCTFLDYQDIFEKNWFGTKVGKRRCFGVSNLGDALTSDERTQNSDDKNDSLSNKVKAAPITRRRQTCSALQDTPKPKKDNLPPIKVVLRRLSVGGTFGVQTENLNYSLVETEEIENKQQHKELNFVQNVKVKLKKLSFEEIEAKINSKKNKWNASGSLPSEDIHNVNEDCSKENSFNSSEEPILVPVSSVPVDCLTKSIPRPLRHLNDNINMTLNSTKFCAICNKRPVDLTSHYVLQHKTESYVSRLTSAEIDNLESHIKLATANRKRYKITCVFCQDELEVHHFVQFHAHYSYHTGEYGFKCDVCEVVKPYREDIKSHQHRTSRCRNGKIRTNYLYQPDLKVIYLYVCKLCNFVQLNEANIHKHQRDHHSFRFEEPENVKKCIICALDDIKVINELLPSNETESLQQECLEWEYDKSGKKLLPQEQEFIHECPLDIKDVLINIENENNLQNEEIKGPKCDNILKRLEPSSSSETPVVQLHDIKSSSKNITLNDAKAVTSESVDEKRGISSSSDLSALPDLVPRLHALNSATIDKISCWDSRQEMRSSALMCTEKNSNTNSVNGKNINETHEELPHGFVPNNVMTIIHRKDQASCIENHRPYEVPMDVNEIKIENIDEPESSDLRSSPVKQFSYRKVIPGKNYFGLYKCMISDCWFSTNEAEKYIRHVDTHSVDGKKLILYCAYCASKKFIAKQLVRHIRTRHSMSLFQCSICTYRSMLPGNVCFHLEMNHKGITEEKCIFKCAGRVRTLESKLTALKEKMKDNVKKFVCRDCPAQYYSMSLIKSHLEATQHNANSSGFAKYACMFCEVESNSLIEMQVHLVALHPNDMCYVVERELNNETDEDSFKNLKMINISPPTVEGVKVRVAEFKEEVSEAVQIIDETEMNLIERIKPLLVLITENTGVYRSELYKCPVCSGSFFTYDLWLNHVQNRHDMNDKIDCPYCPHQVTFDEVIPHFESHLRHEYFCLHCVQTFGSKLELEEHFDTSHKSFDKLIEKPIVYSNMRTYYIMKGEEALSTDWVPILENFLKVLRSRCIEKLYDNRNSEWCYGLAEFCFEDVDLPQFVTGLGTIFKCLVNSCLFESPDEYEFDIHLNQHTVPRNFKCSYCMKGLQPSWEYIKDHYMLHRSNTSYTCCVCKFIHHNRAVLTEHIQKFHNIRDVPIIRLWRDGTKCKISVSIVMPANKIGFVTTTYCIFCRQGMTNGREVMNHLIDAHGIALCSKCEICEEILLSREETESHPEKHEGTIFKIRYDILVPSPYDLYVTSISPLSIDMKLKTKKRLPEVETESSKKRIKSDEQFCLNIKQETNKDDCEDVNINNYNSFKKPSCSIKCVNIDQLVTNRVSSTFQPLSTRGSIYIKPVEDLQIRPPALCPSNTLNYNHQKSNQLSVDTTNHQIANNPNDNIQLRRIPQSQQATSMAAHPTQFILSQLYSKYNTPPTPLTMEQLHVSQPQLTQYIPPESTTISASQYNSSNNIEHVRYQQAPPPEPATHQSLSSLSPQVGTISIEPKLPKHLQPQKAIMSITLPNNQGIATISRNLLPPSSSYLNSVVIAPSVSFQTNQTQIQNPNQKVQTMEEIAKTIDINCPEIIPICEECKAEYSNFVQLLSHFHAVHASSFRFLYHIERRVECVHCSYRGSISSLTAHYNTFHPGKACLCRSVIDPNRCGICHGVFDVNPSVNSTNHPKCNCPTHRRVIADCISIDTLQLLQKFGKKSIGYLCPICNEIFHFGYLEYSNHIKTIHNRSDIPPQMRAIGLLYSCFLCGMTTMRIQDLIIHMSDVHMVNKSRFTLDERLLRYKKFRLIYPRGLILSLSDLCNTGFYEEENLKVDIQTVDAMSRN